MTAPSTSVGQGYQGYPYRNPLVIDAPSIDAETAAKWANLPRNPIVPVQRPNRNNNNVNIDVPGDESEDRANSSDTDRVNQKAYKRDSDLLANPVVYIDFPLNERGECIVEDNRRADTRGDNSTENESSNFVEDTIFYDPFENRRINMGQNQSTRPDNDNSTTDTTSNDMSLVSPQPESSSLGTSSSSAHRVPPFVSKESHIYGSRDLDDKFPKPSIPISDFPEPPPAYSEIDRPVRQPEQPPRTEVIVPERPDSATTSNAGRKLISCPYCGVRVLTLAIKENGAFTHVVACLFLILLAPLVFLVYCTDYFKYTNHYCPQCSQLIGYEVPILCQDMVYTKID